MVQKKLKMYTFTPEPNMTLNELVEILKFLQLEIPAIVFQSLSERTKRHFK